MGSGASRLGRGRRCHLRVQLSKRAHAHVSGSRQNQLCGEGHAAAELLRGGGANPKGERAPFEIFFVLGFLNKKGLV